MPQKSLLSRIFYTRCIFIVISSILEYISTQLFFAGNFWFTIFEWLYIRNFDKEKRQKSSDCDSRGDWEDSRVVSRRKRYPHVVLRSFLSTSNAQEFWDSGGSLSDTVSACNIHYLTGLSGLPDPQKSWKFSLVGCPTASPEGWVTSEYNDNNWVDAALPAHWQCQGHDIPIYTNTAYPFRFDPPRARRDGQWMQTDCDGFLGGTPAGTTIQENVGENATGLYRKTFHLPPHWVDNSQRNRSSSRVFLVFEGADAALEVWVNGKYVGYSQDSCLPAEFEITDILSQSESSEHLLCCRVMRWCDGSYIEDQDKWWLSGIYREVYLLRKPMEAMIADYEVTTHIHWYENKEESDEMKALVASSATVRVDVLTETLMGFAGGEVEVKLSLIGESDPVLILCSPLPPVEHEKDSMCAFNSATFPNRAKADTVANAVESEADISVSTSHASVCVSLEGTLSRPSLWSAEEPSMYCMVVCLKDAEGTVIDVEACRVGVKEVLIGGPHNQLLVNRRPITIAGVNRHEFDCYQGRAVSEKIMHLDASLMKQLNFNAVRLSHYPTHHRWLEICDAAGLYVIDEANIESHGFQWAGQPVGYLSSLPEWRGAHLSRVARMYERDKNAVSIIGWSLGNESGIGAAHRAMYAWLKARDSSGRVVQYEPGGARSEVTDIICPMYLRPKWCMTQALTDKKKRPVVLCEYAHAMGNSSGGLHDYWDKFWDPAYPRLQGGFIWDFVDQGLVLGKTAGCYGYGGDFGDVPNSKQFCINGILGPDRKPHPIAYEAGALQSPVAVELIVKDTMGETLGEEGIYLSLRVKNRRSFINLSDMVLCLSIGTDTAPVSEELSALHVPLADHPSIFPGSSGVIEISSLWKDLMQSMLKRRLDLQEEREDLTLNVPPREAWMDICVCNTRTSEWVCAGHVITRVSLHHPRLLWHVTEFLQNHPIELFSPNTLSSKSLSLREDVDRNFCVEWSDGSRATVGRACGRLLTWTVGGVDTISSPLDMCFWRAPTDNDMGGADLSYYAQWIAAGLNCLHRKESSVSVVVIALPSDSHSGGNIIVKASWIFVPSREASVPACIPCEVMYTFTSSGSVGVKFSAQLSAALPPVPRVGLRTAVAGSLVDACWLGLGPFEAYDDRTAAAYMGLFECSIDELHTAYVFPQECGRRQGLRWVSLTDPMHGGGLQVEVERPENSPLSQAQWGWSASRYSLENLEATKHNHELEADPNGQVHLHIDRACMGIGGYDSWSPNVGKDFLIQTGQTISGTISLAPIRA